MACRNNHCIRGRKPRNQIKKVVVSSLLVPKAKDAPFSPATLKNAGGFTVGRKEDERKMTDYEQALAYLRAQPSAYWRRP